MARKLAKRFFIERGNPKVAWDAGVNAGPIQVAINYNIPTVFSPEKIIKPSNSIDEVNLQGLNCAGYGSSVNVTATFAFIAVSFILNNL